VASVKAPLLYVLFTITIEVTPLHQGGSKGEGWAKAHAPSQVWAPLPFPPQKRNFCWV